MATPRKEEQQSPVNWQQEVTHLTSCCSYFWPDFFFWQGFQYFCVQYFGWHLWRISWRSDKKIGKINVFDSWILTKLNLAPMKPIHLKLAATKPIHECFNFFRGGVEIFMGVGSWMLASDGWALWWLQLGEILTLKVEYLKSRVTPHSHLFR